MLKLILLLVIFLDIFLSFFIFSENRKSWNNRIFSLLSFFAAIWTFTNYMTGVYATAFWLESTYAIGSLVLGIGLIWVFFLVDKILDKKKLFIVSLGAVSLFISSYLEGFIAKKYEKIYFGGAFVGESGFGLIIYALIFLTAVVLILYKLFFAWKQEINKETKSGLIYVFYGALATLTISFLTSFIFPIFHIFILSGLDSVGFLIFLSFIAYAIARHHLFNIKIIATELLTFSIWIFILIQTLLADSIKNQFINGTLLLLVIMFGVLLIKSVIKEVEQREKLEVLTKELNATNERLVKLNKLKSEFLSFASHQVKTPITIVKGYASLIASGNYGEVSDKIKEIVLRIVSASDRMVSLVNSILDSRRIEDGRMEYKFGEVEVVGLVSNVVTDLKSVAENKGLSFKIELSDEKLIVKADEEKLRQVIQNILDNAIKYTDQGWIEVNVKKESDSLLVSISDSGRGISQELLPRIFEQWTRDSKVVMEIQGTGLGLYIAKEIIIAHGGEIWVESSGAGKGSTFYVKLKLLK